MSAPRELSADLKAKRVFDGASSSPPWWAMLRKRFVSQGLGFGATALVPAAVIPHTSIATAPARAIRAFTAPELRGFVTARKVWKLGCLLGAALRQLA